MCHILYGLLENKAIINKKVMVQLAMVKLGNVKEMIGERWGGVTHREGKAVKQCQWGELNKYTHTHTQAALGSC